MDSRPAASPPWRTIRAPVPTVGSTVTAGSLSRSLAYHRGIASSITGRWATVDWTQPPLGEQLEWLPDLSLV